MQGRISGPAIVMPDDVNTDLLQPSRFFSLDKANRVSGVLTGLGKETVAGAIIVGGRCFGVGSSREAVIRGLIEAGIRAVVARSVSRIFLRNAVNHGLPVFQGLEPEHGLEEGDNIEIDLSACVLRCPGKGIERGFEPLDPYLESVLASGGLLGYLRQSCVP